MSLATTPPLRQPELRGAVAAYLLAVADDELILGHRHSEWTGFAPDIESDVALSSVAQEEMGHARLFYERTAQLTGADADRLAFGRSAGEFHNAMLVERPDGDWGFTIVRMFLYDRADAIRLDALAGGEIAPLAELARQLRREEKYHLRYGEEWLRRLAQATAASRARVQEALDAAWPDAEALFEPVAGQEMLERGRVLQTGVQEQARTWRGQVTPVLASFDLRVPIQEKAVGPGGRAGRHTDDLRILLDEMTSVWRTEPDARW